MTLSLRNSWQGLEFEVQQVSSRHLIRQVRTSRPMRLLVYLLLHLPVLLQRSPQAQHQLFQNQIQSLKLTLALMLAPRVRSAIVIRQRNQNPKSQKSTNSNETLTKIHPWMALLHFYLFCTCMLFIMFMFHHVVHVFH